MNWQPIETAPKDGTRVLLYWAAATLSNQPFFACGRWNDDRYNKKPRPYWDGDMAHNGKREYQQNPPTLWAEIILPER